MICAPWSGGLEVAPASVTVAAVAASLLAGGGAWLIWSAWAPPAGNRSRRFAGPSGSDRTGRPLRAAASVAGWGAGGAGAVRLDPGVMFTAVWAAVGGGVLGWALFASVVPALGVAVFAGTFPAAAARRRQSEQRRAAAEAWPQLLEEIRMRTGSLGRSVPQALFEAGRRAPEIWRPAFREAEREWMLTTDFGRTTGLLRHRLDDATADVVCETLAVAHELGGSDLDGRLADLIEDRVTDLEARRDAESRLAGVRFARRFVLVVPLGMAVAGLTIGAGRHAYASPGGQLAVVAALVGVAACWWWSSRLMRVPEPPRVLR